MKGGNYFNGNHAPSPPHSTEKTFYQSRKGVTPTRTSQVGFKSTEEDGERELYAAPVMAYTSINNREPTPEEKGHATEQKTKGGYSNRFK